MFEEQVQTMLEQVQVDTHVLQLLRWVTGLVWGYEMYLGFIYYVLLLVWTETCFVFFSSLGLHVFSRFTVRVGNVPSGLMRRQCCMRSTVLYH